MASDNDLSQDLLLGLLALQNGLIDRTQLMAALAARDGSTAPGLAAQLQTLGALTDSRRQLLEALTSEHVAQHGGDPIKSLAAIEVSRSTLDDLTNALPSNAATLSFLSQATGDFTRGGPAADPFNPESVSSGVHRFKVLRPHAKGGLGAVFVAVDNELSREVALKEILDCHADDPELRKRFLLEAEITGGLEHPGIVPVYGLGTYDSGRPYYAMRFIKGDSLKEAVDAFHLDPSLAGPARALAFRNLLRRFTDVCNAIDYAHSRGVLHRDIKPGNVIVGKHGETLVVDWGLAKPWNDVQTSEQGERPLSPSSASGTAETLPGSVMGTPGFMSPEQAAGDIHRLGARSDVYSLGATLYSLLTGQSAFKGTVQEVLDKARRGEFPPVRAVKPSVDPALEAVCHKAMATTPEDRHDSARALADDIERWLADEPVLARREPIAERARRWARHHRTGVAAGLTAAAVALVGVGFLAVFQAWANIKLSESNGNLIEANLRESRARNEEARARTRAEGRIDLALRAIEQFREAVENNLDLRDRPENSQLRRELLEAPLRFHQSLRDDLKADARSDPAAKLKLADSLQSLAQVSRQLGSQPDALSQLTEALGLTEEVVASTAAPEALRRGALDRGLSILCKLGILQEVLGDPTVALATFERGRTEARAELHARPEDPKLRLLLAKLLYSIGMNQYKLGKLDESLSRSDEALQELAEALRLSPEEGEAEELRWVVLSTLRVPILLKRSQIEDALAANQAARSAAGRARALGRSSSLLESAEAKLLMNRADALLSLGREREHREALESSVQAYREAINRRPTAYSARLNLASVLLELVNAERALGEAKTANAKLAEAISLLEALRADYPKSASVYEELSEAATVAGTSAYQDGKPDEALAEFRKVSEYAEAYLALDPDHVSMLGGLAGNEYNLGILLSAVGKVEEAKACYERSEGLRRKLMVEHPDQPLYRLHLAHTLGNLAGLFQREGNDPDKTERLLREAVDLLSGLAKAFPKSAPVRDSFARNSTSLCSLLINDAKLVEAGRRLLEVHPFLDRRVESEPRAIQPKIDLALNLREQGTIYRLTGREGEAKRVHRQAIALLEPLVTSGADRIDAPRAMALSELNLARDLNQPNEALEAAELAGQAASRFESLRDAGKVDAETTRSLVEADQTRARRLASLGRLTDAEASWKRAEAHQAPEAPVGDDSGRVELLAWAGDFEGFLAGSRAIEAAGGLPKERLLEMAGAASLASGRCAPDRAEPLASLAVRWLLRARDLGAFRRGQDRSVLLKPEYVPLKGRDDFQILWLDVAFPTDPFAPGSEATD